MNKMAKNSVHVVPFRRKREGKTNYRRRLTLLRSGKLRVVIRKSLKFIQIQLIKYEPDGDKVLLTVHSRELKKYGWDGSYVNLPASYLTGLLFGIKARDYKKGIVDFGMQTVIKGNKLYAALKGVVEAGFSIPHDPSVFPPESRLVGEHINKDLVNQVNSIKEKILKEN